MSQIQVEAEAFAKTYGQYWDTPDASTLDGHSNVATNAGRCYTPACTILTNGEKSTLESPEAATALIAKEMRKNIASKLGCHMTLEDVKSTVYSETSVLCWITFTFHPQPEHELEGRTWTFTNVYGYRAAQPQLGQQAGWEFVLRDQEVNEMVKVAGWAFNN
ncbi:hypothetical protein Q7P37_004549 [Cladosporium fusiforme]